MICVLGTNDRMTVMYRSNLSSCLSVSLSLCLPVSREAENDAFFLDIEKAIVIIAEVEG